MTTRARHIQFHADTPETAGIGVAPLVDIVLLLICFYLFVSKSIENYEDPSIELPAITHVRSPGEKPAEYIINLRPDGAMNLNDQPVSAEELFTALRAERERLRRTGRGPIVVIRADRRQPFGVLSAVLDLCQRADISNVSIRAVER